MLLQHAQAQEKELQKLDLRIHNSGQSPPAHPTTCRVHLRFKLATISLLHFTLFLLCSWLLESSLRKATTYILVRVPFYARCGIARRPPLICLSKLRAPSFYSPQNVRCIRNFDPQICAFRAKAITLCSFQQQVMSLKPLFLLTFLRLVGVF